MELYIFSKQFRQILKTSNYEDYLSFGHRPTTEKPITLWIMDENGYIDTFINEDQNVIHSTIFSDHKLNVAKAFGRFDPRTREISATASEVPYEREKPWIEEVLKDHFGKNLKVYWLD